MAKYFGTDGIRGKAHDFLSYDLAFRIGNALGVLGNNRLHIARDTRESGPMLVDAIKEGAIKAGLEIMDDGILPTPALAYLSAKYQAIGVMVTASHNPYHDNGIKVFDRGMKLFPETEAKIEAAIDDEHLISRGQHPKMETREINPVDEYLELFNGFVHKCRFSVGLDLANGATTSTGVAVFEKFSDNLHVIGNEPDGFNINLDVGSTHPEAICELVRKENLDYGFAFDGDGDRLMVCDRGGMVYDGDKSILLIAKYLKQKGLLKHDQVVLTKMSNIGIIKALGEAGISVLEADVGDKYVLEMLEKNDLVLGGENSGHIINRTLLDTGDGVLNAAFLLHILDETGLSLAEQVGSVVMYPDNLVNLRDIDTRLVKHPELVQLVANIQNELGTDGKLLVRPSGTEPVIRVYVSARSMSLVEKTIERVVTMFDGLK